jgi:thiol-disulfide isomerase/thioredoxin
MKYLLPIFLTLLLCAVSEAQSQTSMGDSQSMEPDKSDDHNFLPLGEMTAEQIINGSRVFNMHYVDYVPNSDAVQAIHNYPKPLEIKVFWGDWCKDSKKYIPGFIKSIEFAENKKIQIIYINMDRQKKEPAEAIAGWNILNIPTFVVISNGKEVGRVVETPKDTIEQDIASILSQIPN